MLAPAGRERHAPGGRHPLRRNLAQGLGAAILVRPDGRDGIERFRLKVGAQDIDAVEHGLGVDLLGLALERQIIVGNGDSEVLGHLVVIDHGPDRERDWPAAKIEALRCVLRDEAVAPVDQQALTLLRSLPHASNCGLADLDAELDQFSVDAGHAPQRV